MTLYMYAGGQGARGGYATREVPRLYSLELDARSYERLRRQESLLVDFTEFLNNMVWLLQQACGAGGEGKASFCSAARTPADNLTSMETKETAGRRTFRAVLCGGSDPLSGSGPTTLQIKEHTAFRELAHLTLPVQENTEKGLARFLAGRLNELIQENQRYQTRIDALEHEGRKLEQQLSVLQQQMSADTSLHSNEATNWKMQCDLLRSQVASAKEQHDFLKEQARIAEMGASRDKSQLVEVEATCAAMQEEVAELKKKVEAYAHTNSNLEETKLHNEREIARLREVCEGYKSASGLADARVEDWKRMANSHEEQAAKVVQEAQILEKKLLKTANELEQVRKHVHESDQRTAQRDALMRTQEEALQSAQSRVIDLQQHQRELEAQLDDAKKQLEEAKAQAADTAKKCDNSEKMIVWLNKQLTNIQLGGCGGSIGTIKSGNGNVPVLGSVKGGGGNGNTNASPPPSTKSAVQSMKTSTPSPLQPRSRLARAS